ncbi:14744_t:CDS:1, partial [Gigaspora margarita]
EENELFTLDIFLLEKGIKNLKMFVNKLDFKAEFFFKIIELYYMDWMDLDLPTASKDILFFDPDNYLICREYLIKICVYINSGQPNHW